jgi:hypothetical protein
MNQRIWRRRLTVLFCVGLLGGLMGWHHPATRAAADLVAGATYTLRSACSDKALDISDISTDDGAKAQIWAANGGANQQFKLHDAGGGYYALIAQHSGKALDVSGHETTDGTPVQQWTYSGADNQLWSVTPFGDGVYNLISKASGKALDVNSAGTADGTPVQLWSVNGACAQQWRLEAQSTTPNETALPEWAQAITGAPEALANDPAGLVTIRVPDDQPTFDAALQDAQNKLNSGQSVKIQLAGGAYHTGEHIIYGSEASRNASLIIEGAPGQDVTLTGSETWEPSGWTPRTVNGVTYYEHPWDFKLGFEDGGWGAYGPRDLRAQRAEMVFVNDQLLRQNIIEEHTYTPPSGYTGSGSWTYTATTPPDQALAKAGSYGVAELDASGQYARRMFVRPPDGVDWNSAKIEVATKRYLIWVLGQNNVVFRNLNIEHYAATPSGYSGAVLIGNRWWEPFNKPSNVLIENVRFGWNNMMALSLFDISNMTLRNVTADYQGYSGFGGWGWRNVVLDGVTTSYNNWRGMYANFSGWAIAGLKITSSDGIRLRNFRAIGNQTWGLWFDLHVKNVLIDGYTGFENLNGGLFLEISPGPFLVQNSVIARSGNAGDLLIADARDVTVRDSILYSALGQGRGVFEVVSDHGRSPIEGADPADPNDIGPVAIENSVLAAGPTDPTPALVFSEGGSFEDYSAMLQQRFSTRDVMFFAPTDMVFGTCFKFNCMTDHAGFVAFTGQSGSTWADPKFTNPDGGDFTLRGDSPLQGRTLPAQAIPASEVGAAAEFRFFVYNSLLGQ